MSQSLQMNSKGMFRIIHLLFHFVEWRKNDLMSFRMPPQPADLAAIIAARISIVTYNVRVYAMRGGRKIHCIVNGPGTIHQTGKNSIHVG